MSDRNRDLLGAFIITFCWVFFAGELVRSIY